MSDETYQGFKNHQTWNCNLWIDNDQNTHLYWREETANAWDGSEVDEVLSRKERAIQNLEDTLKEWVEENNPLKDKCSMYSDILSANLSEINYREIATGWIETLMEDDALHDITPQMMKNCLAVDPSTTQEEISDALTSCEGMSLEELKKEFYTQTEIFNQNGDPEVADPAAERLLELALAIACKKVEVPE